MVKRRRLNRKPKREKIKRKHRLLDWPLVLLEEIENTRRKGEWPKQGFQLKRFTIEKGAAGPRSDDLGG